MSFSLIGLKNIVIYSFPAITFIGLITNSLSFIIFSCKRFQKTIFSTYFRLYLVFVSISLILSINKMLESNFNIYLSKISDIACKLRVFFSYVNYPIAAWLLVVISLDRYLTIAFPVKFSFHKRFQFQMLICCFIVGFNFCIFIPYLFNYLQKIESNGTIQIKCTTLNIWVELIDYLESTLIPFCLMIIFTSLTIKTVFDARNSTSIKPKDMKFAVSSIIFNIIFLFFNSPVLLLSLMKNYTHLFVNLSDLYEFLNSLSLFFLYLNTTLTFFVNYFINSIFKKEFELMLSFLRNYFKLTNNQNM
jgi:hypothetical protein